MSERRGPGRARRRTRLAGAIALSAGGCALVVWSADGGESRLGAPAYWAWLLTGLQVLGLWAAGRRLWWAWLLGAGVQPVWIVYAVLTSQLGFVPGCLVSAAVQLRNFLCAGQPRSKPAPWHVLATTLVVASGQFLRCVARSGRRTFGLTAASSGLAAPIPEVEHDIG
jgi:hypothetical protein